MLGQAYRLRQRSQIARLYRKSERAQSSALTLKAAPNQRQKSRLAVVVSTKISKRATVRNRIRRRVLGSVEALWPQLNSGFDLLIIVRTDIESMPTEQLGQQLKNCLRSVGAWPKQP